MRKISVIILSVFLGAMLVLGVQSCKGGKPQNEHSGHSARKQIYQCPMHPNYTSDRPGKCPICGMDLVPVKQAEQKTDGPEKTAIPGLSEVKITPQREQIIGVKTSSAGKRRLFTRIRASGRIAHDVELYNAIVEYRQALGARDRAKTEGASQEYIQQTESLLNSALFKLQHMGLSDALIEEFAQRTQPPTNLLYAGKAGETVWVYAQVYEYESGLVKPGQIIEVTSNALPGKKFTGAVKSLDSFVDEQSRTLKVRAEISNSEGLLRPEMYVNTLINVELGVKLAVPVESVLDTGTRQIVFVKKGPGIYEPREVRVGQEANGYYEVLSGLSAGEQVVTSANFLIDSESRLKSAIQEMKGAGHQHGK